MNNTISFIGGGNMASSLIGGLLANSYDANLITVAEPNDLKRQQLAEQFKISTTQNNTAAVLSADIVILAIKPQLMQQVCREIATTSQQKRPLIISIAAGIRGTDIDRWLGDNCAIIRCMPNTPSLIQQGATGLFANSSVSKEQLQLAETILSATGITVWVNDETQLNAVTAVSGSGPAYFFLLMEAIQKAGESLGLETDTVRQLTLQTALGAAQMAINSIDSPEELRKKVTSKGGTTEAAINSLQSNNFEKLVIDALTEASLRAAEMADILGKDQ